MKESGRRDSFRYLSHAYNTRVVPLLILFARVVLLPRFAILQLKPLMTRVFIDHHPSICNKTIFLRFVLSFFFLSFVELYLTLNFWWNIDMFSSFYFLFKFNTNSLSISFTFLFLTRTLSFNEMV